MATLRELVTGKGFDASQGIIDEVSKLVPELDFFDAITIQGTSFQSVSQTSDPTTGFRAINNGVDASDEGYELKNFNLGSIITPKNISADLVVSYARARQNSIDYGESNVETLYKIVDNKVEALEFKVSKNSPVAGVPVLQLKLKPDILLGCIIKGKKMSIVNGQSVINEGDTVIVITTRKGLKDIRDILAQ